MNLSQESEKVHFFHGSLKKIQPQDFDPMAVDFVSLCQNRCREYHSLHLLVCGYSNKVFGEHI